MEHRTKDVKQISATEAMERWWGQGAACLTLIGRSQRSDASLAQRRSSSLA